MDEDDRVEGDKVDLKEMAVLLLDLRGGESRREVAERSGLSSSHLQKIEDGRSQDVTLSTLVRLAHGYEVSPLKLFCTAVPLDVQDVLDWIMSEERFRPGLERALGGRVVVEAQLAPELKESLDAINTKIERAFSTSRPVKEELDDLRNIVERMGRFVDAFGSLIANPVPAETSPSSE